MPCKAITINLPDEIICDLCNEANTGSEKIEGCGINTWMKCPKCIKWLKEGLTKDKEKTKF